MIGGQAESTAQKPTKVIETERTRASLPDPGEDRRSCCPSGEVAGCGKYLEDEVDLMAKIDLNLTTGRLRP